MNAVAPDDIWLKFSWQGSEIKNSFSEVMGAFLLAIKKVCRETFTECEPKYCDAKIKSFLRHTEERVKRSNSKNSKPKAAENDE